MNIPEIRLTPTPDTSQAKDAIGFRWADKAVGQRHKLGGSPNWISKDETPLCTCGIPMTFYGQLDSIGDDYTLADCGMIYVFVCFDCFETKSVLQTS